MLIDSGAGTNKT